MLMYPSGLGLNFCLIFISSHTLCMSVAKALASLCRALPKPSLQDNAIFISTKILCIGSSHFFYICVGSVIAIHMGSVSGLN